MRIVGEITSYYRVFHGIFVLLFTIPNAETFLGNASGASQNSMWL